MNEKKQKDKRAQIPSRILFNMLMFFYTPPCCSLDCQRAPPPIQTWTWHRAPHQPDWESTMWPSCTACINRPVLPSRCSPLPNVHGNSEKMREIFVSSYTVIHHNYEHSGCSLNPCRFTQFLTLIPFYLTMSMASQYALEFYYYFYY